MKTLRIKGFTLLFAILTVSALLGVVVAIIGLATKQLTLSTVGKESQVAFYAANSGAECARFWDIRLNSFATGTDPLNIKKIKCGAKEFLVGGHESRSASQGLNGETVGIVPCGTTQCVVSTFEFSLTNAANAPTAFVTVSKNWDTGETIIESFGRNIKDTTSSRRIERAVRLTYTTAPSELCTTNGDIMVLMDVSGSLDATEFSKVKDATAQLVEGLYNAPSDINIGFITIKTDPGFVYGLTNVSQMSTVVNGIRNYSRPNTGLLTNMAAAIRLARYELSGIKQPTNPTTDVNSSDPQVPPDNRDDALHPNYIVIITDGAARGIVHDDGTYTFEEEGSPAALQSTEKEANDAKLMAGVTIYTIGIGTDTTNCQNQTCTKFMNYQLAGSPGDTDPTTPANPLPGNPGQRYSYIAHDFDELPTIVASLYNCY